MNPVKKMIFALLKFFKIFVNQFNIHYTGIFEKLIEDCDTILDLGCGNGKFNALRFF